MKISKIQLLGIFNKKQNNKIKKLIIQKKLISIIQKMTSTIFKLLALCLLIDIYRKFKETSKIRKPQNEINQLKKKKKKK